MRFIGVLGLTMVACTSGSGVGLDASVTTRDAAAVVNGDAAMAHADANLSGAIMATLDQRCSYFERAGTIAVNDVFDHRHLEVALNDRPHPFLGPPTLTTNDCVYFQAGAGCACPGTQTCNAAGQCVMSPALVTDVRVTVSGAGATQEFSGDGQFGGEITDVTNTEIALRIAARDFVITTPNMSIPPHLSMPEANLTGTYDMPDAVDLLWAPAAAGPLVGTHININHHVANGTFTECFAPAAQGMIHIDGPMLRPLAVSTGLEFQGIDHIRFARADTSIGCVEIRFVRSAFVSLD